MPPDHEHVVRRVAVLFGDYTDWYAALCDAAKVGYPVGGSPGRGSGVPDPTYAAVVGKDPARQERRDHDRDIADFLAVLARLEKRKLWVQRSNGGLGGPGTRRVDCEGCGEALDDRPQRNGLCPACYAKALRKERREAVNAPPVGPCPGASPDLDGGRGRGRGGHDQCPESHGHSDPGR